MNKWTRLYETVNNEQVGPIETFIINNAKICEWTINHGIMNRMYEYDTSITNYEEQIEKIILLKSNEKESFYLKGNGEFYADKVLAGNGATGTIIIDNKTLTIENGIITEIKEQ